MRCALGHPVGAAGVVAKPGSAERLLTPSPLKAGLGSQERVRRFHAEPRRSRILGAGEAMGELAQSNPCVTVACNWVAPPQVSASSPVMEQAWDGSHRLSALGVSAWEGWTCM